MFRKRSTRSKILFIIAIFAAISGIGFTLIVYTGYSRMENSREISGVVATIGYQDVFELKHRTYSQDQLVPKTVLYIDLEESNDTIFIKESRRQFWNAIETASKAGVAVTFIEDSRHSAPMQLVINNQEVIPLAYSVSGDNLIQMLLGSLFSLLVMTLVYLRGRWKNSNFLE
jgi:hypothetical protein